MPRRRWKRRTIVISSVIVALSIGLIFTTIAYLPRPNPAHGSIQQSLTRTVRPGNQSYPGIFDVRIQNVTLTEDFWVGVGASGGAASFYALVYQTYFNWKLNYNLTQSPGNTFPCNVNPSVCVGQVQQTSQQTLKFPVTPGDWAIVALNTNSFPIIATFSPA